MSNENNRLRGLPGMGDGTGLQINVVEQNGQVHLTFSKPVMVLMLSPQQALGMSISMAERAYKAQWPPPPVSPIIPPPGT